MRVSLIGLGSLSEGVLRKIVEAVCKNYEAIYGVIYKRQLKSKIDACAYARKVDNTRAASARSAETRVCLIAFAA